MTARIIISGSNAAISSTAFSDIGRGLAPLGGRASHHHEVREMPGEAIQTHISFAHRGGGTSLDKVEPAAELFWSVTEIALLLFLFVAVPIWMMLAP